MFHRPDFSLCLEQLAQDRERNLTLAPAFAAPKRGLHEAVRPMRQAVLETMLTRAALHVYRGN